MKQAENGHCGFVVNGDSSLEALVLPSKSSTARDTVHTDNAADE